MKFYNNIICITVFTVLNFTFSSFSQEIIEIKGNIIDAETREPLQFASVGVKGYKLGTISNQNGEFKLKVTNDLIEKKIIVSHLGYKSKAISIKEGIGKYLIIKLVVQPFSLNAINVKHLTAQDIILGALQRIPKNYLDKPANLKAFYIENIKENDTSIQYVELVLDIYKGNYGAKNDRDKIRIIEGHEEENIKKSDFFDHMYFIDGPFEAVQLDIAKYPRSFIHVLQTSTNFLHPRHFKCFDYQLTEHNHKKTKKTYYQIEFKPFKNRALLKGNIIIDKEDLAILLVEFSLDDQKQKRAMMIDPRNEIFLNNAGFFTKANTYNCKVEFCKYEDKYVLSNSHMDYSFFFSDNVKQKTLKIANSIDLVITSVDNENAKRFRNRRRLWKGVSLSKQVGKYDPDFWKNFKEVKPVVTED